MDELPQQVPITAHSSVEPLRIPGESPAYHCSDPSGDIFRIDRLDFIPTNPRHFITSTGDVPWLNITGSINGRPELEPMYFSPLCDVDVFQYAEIPIPGSDEKAALGLHRSCPPSIQDGYAVISSPPIPLRPDMVPTGKWEVRAEAQTQDRRRIFCVKASFDVTF
ncbi:phosphatidylglycerol phosphatidylinositol transfer [Fusarium albosuccineum]|uniref:Phosphatidylglycerol phosphatidylinositol transfer n=1 Tax=Fusarium albosuccineum TaxID=1237068 RepID=A0A8H4P4W0_9HYPO|nr:phosphatidylglycerol phosphatidylinositol transfer [Fusarium albosuccineum]